MTEGPSATPLISWRFLSFYIFSLLFPLLYHAFCLPPYSPKPFSHQRYSEVILTVFSIPRSLNREKLQFGLFLSSEELILKWFIVTSHRLASLIIQSKLYLGIPNQIKVPGWKIEEFSWACPMNNLQRILLKGMKVPNTKIYEKAKAVRLLKLHIIYERLQMKISKWISKLVSEWFSQFQ